MRLKSKNFIWDQYIEQVRTVQEWFGNQTYNVFTDFPNLIDQEIGKRNHVSRKM